MSSEPTRGEGPNRNSPQLDSSVVTDNLAGTPPSDLPHDPLLRSGSFIDANGLANGEAVVRRETIRDHQSAERPHFRQSPSVMPPPAAAVNSNGSEPATPLPPPENTDSKQTPRRSQGGAAAGTAGTPNWLPPGWVVEDRVRTSGATAGSVDKGEGQKHNSPQADSSVVIDNHAETLPFNLLTPAVGTPNWLPPGWVVEDKVRTSGATAGSIDKYYFDPVSSRRFRSKNEVLYFLETGTVRKKRKTTENSDANVDSSGSSTQNMHGTNTSDPPFDFFNVPEKVSWILTDASKDTWVPFIGDGKVPESSQRQWDAAFTSLATKDAGHRLF